MQDFVKLSMVKLEKEMEEIVGGASNYPYDPLIDEEELERIINDPLHPFIPVIRYGIISSLS